MLRALLLTAGVVGGQVTNPSVVPASIRWPTTLHVSSGINLTVPTNETSRTAAPSTWPTTFSNSTGIALPTSNETLHTAASSTWSSIFANSSGFLPTAPTNQTLRTAAASAWPIGTANGTVIAPTEAFNTTLGTAASATRPTIFANATGIDPLAAFNTTLGTAASSAWSTFFPNATGIGPTAALNATLGTAALSTWSAIRVSANGIALTAPFNTTLRVAGSTIRSTGFANSTGIAPTAPANTTLPTCPPLETTTITETLELTESYFDGTTTSTYTTTSTVFSTATSDVSTEYNYLAGSTTVLTDDETVTIISIDRLPAQTTTTAFTTSSFTPVLCEPTYRNPTVQVVVTTTVTIPRVAWDPTYVSETLTSTIDLYSFTETITTPLDLTLSETATVIVISTYSDATRTRYSACETNNVVSQRPDLFFVDGIETSPDVDIYYASSADPVECCEICHDDPSCAGSVFDTTTSDLPCGILIRNAGGASNCDPTYNSANVTLRAYPDVKAYISNGNCGQIGFSD